MGDRAEHRPAASTASWAPARDELRTVRQTGGADHQGRGAAVCGPTRRRPLSRPPQGHTRTAESQLGPLTHQVRAITDSAHWQDFGGDIDKAAQPARTVAWRSWRPIALMAERFRLGQSSASCAESAAKFDGSGSFRARYALQCHPPTGSERSLRFNTQRQERTRRAIAAGLCSLPSAPEDRPRPRHG